DNLLILLEKRLDNIVYASNIFPSRAMARQVVSHKLVYVNGKRVDVPSYQVKIGDVITFKFSDKMKKMLDEYSRTKKNAIENDHVYYDKDKKELKVLRDPDITAIKQNIDVKLIVEFYSK
ncbi:MAG TPA: 30S ribosomal protein S4, partial [bacterium]|nr:30S ribosomal protein S4 [bacterium]